MKARPRRMNPRSRPPSMQGITALRAEIGCKFLRQNNDDASVQSRNRRISVVFASELRRRGWLAPEREGYAVGSWAAR